jgi:hypothetical protein
MTGAGLRAEHAKVTWEFWRARAELGDVELELRGVEERRRAAEVGIKR